ncbi:rhodanese-like domain-containing protein [Mesonia ostreae]|uniref:Rhodanese-like domain-containing protein n=1 Tax=Mesonia ostreae TaxID=861110 RepID=A0ABU2KEQ2_9FLAO|nr:rhodanese-like domain-containing protein [Mesonia ostreae]MDT0293187.1 rhodanese-like domain-containing protein [Mesonia ostreae]
MKNNNWMFLFILSTFLTFNSCTESKGNQVNMVSSEEMKKIISLDETQLIDVRDFNEYESGHITDAQNIIYDEDFEANISGLDKTKPVAVYCRTGGRSEKCASILKKAGFEKIYELEGGYEAWTYKDNLE